MILIGSIYSILNFYLDNNNLSFTTNAHANCPWGWRRLTPSHHNPKFCVGTYGNELG